jgi:hypothetical protein
VLAEWGSEARRCDMRLRAARIQAWVIASCVKASVSAGAALWQLPFRRGRMRPGRRNRAGAALGIAIFLTQSSPGNTKAPEASLGPQSCPGAKAQKNPFDETSVTFDSVSEKRDERSALVTYCVHVDAPKNKYLSTGRTQT